jgi:hypothetical protein
MTEQSTNSSKPRIKRGHTFRTSIWFASLLVFAFSSWLGDYASDRKEAFEVEDKWRALAKEMIVEDEAMNVAHADCADYTDCYGQLKQRLNLVEEPQEPLAVQIQSGWYLMLKIIGMIGQFLAGAVIIEGALRLIILVGRHLNILDDEWKSFTDEFLKKIPELVKDGSSATMAVPLLAALTAGGVATAYYASPTPHKTAAEKTSTTTNTITDHPHPAPSDLEKNLDRLTSIVNTANANMASAVRETASAVRATANTVNATAGSVERTAHAVSDHAASAVNVASNMAKSADKLNVSVLALDMAHQASADGYSHNNSFDSAGGCPGLILAQSRGERELRNFFHKLGLDHPRLTPAQLTDQADLILKLLCNANRTPGNPVVNAK